MIDPNNEAAMPNVTRSWLSDAASGAVLALAGGSDDSDSPSAYRRALRAIVAERLYNEYTAPALDGSIARSSSATAVVVASAALSDTDLDTAERRHTGEPHIGLASALRPLLGPDLAEHFAGLTDVVATLTHQHEQWDGNGSPQGIGGVKIPLAARIVRVSTVLVGNPNSGELPDWESAKTRVREQAGTALDPSLCQALDRVDLSTIGPPHDPIDLVASLLTQPLNRAAMSHGSNTTSTIASAVSLAGRTSDLLTLFADTALTSLRAAEVLVFRTTETQFESAPVAKVADGQSPLLDPSRLDDLYEFAMQAELRAGATIARDTCSDGKAIGEFSDRPNDEFIDEIISPIVIDGQVWGSVVATRRRTGEAYDQVDVAQLQRIGADMAAAMKSTSHWSKMEQMALKDQLTGLGNRHELYRVLDQIFERPPIERMDSALIMCDVDGLKTVNDTLGHHAGDRLLIDAAEALRGAVRNRPGTTVCRIGGDEFCVVVDGGALLTVYEISDSIERLFERSAGSGPARSISCGIALADETIESRSALLRAADENQYETKRKRKKKRSREAPARVPLLASALRPDSGDRRAIRD